MSGVPQPRGAGRDAGWLLGGQLVALLAAFIATPIQFRAMGAERYGVVVVVVATAGYLAFLELGAGWALTRFVPWYRATGDPARARALVGSALVLAGGLGAVAGTAVWLLAGPVVELLRLSEKVSADAETALRIMAFFVPAMLLGSVFTGLARAVGMFRAQAVLGAASVIVLNVVWAVVAGSDDDVVIVAATQLGLGVAVVGAWLALLATAHPGLVGLPRLRRDPAREILRFGGFSTVSQLSLGLATQADKVAFASIIPVATLPQYSIPFSIAVRITLISSSVASAIMPRLSAALAVENTAEARRLAGSALRVVALAAGLLVVAGCFAGKPFLELWIGESFAEDAWPALAVLAGGFGLLATGSVGHVLLDARGRVGLNAVLAIISSGAGLGLGIAGALIWETPLAAAAGLAVGLGLWGVTGVELGRRLVLGGGAWQLISPVLGEWLAVAAAGGTGYFLASLASASAALLIPSVLLPSIALASLLYLRERHRAEVSG